ncbi:hypothetical protein DRW07_02005 [Alteromonas sediminis]|uniref:Thoeris protein ThsB TIR-like domain-containing protein n=1 Tax=Alteromonas sediminis TaxID=2259342 RepID=A0A3N5Y683_9ALTE|nr:hypothetical protein DRW07_02005 [Alteromonas sediminis]
MVDKHTHKSFWVKWEIGKAVDLKMKIVAVKIDRSNKTPDELYGVVELVRRNRLVLTAEKNLAQI